MTKNTQGLVAGIAACLLWFAPMVSLGEHFYQSGQHIGGVSYALLLANTAYGVLAWRAQREAAFIAALTALAVCLLLAVQAGASIGWGLVLLMITLAYAAWLARREKLAKGETPEHGTVQ